MKEQRFFIPTLSVGLLEGSAWNTEQIPQRFDNIPKVFQQCGVGIDELDMRKIPNPGHKFDDIEDDMRLRNLRPLSSPFETRLGMMVASFGLQPPALMYLKNVVHTDVVKSLGASTCTAAARAFTVGDIVSQTSPVAGMALVTDAYA